MNTKNSRQVFNMPTSTQLVSINRSQTLFRGQSPPPFMEDLPSSYGMAVVNSLQKTNGQSTVLQDELIG